jgi:probable HAF family extracellular repeat protein
VHLGGSPLTVADDIGTLGGSNSLALGINKAGRVVGDSSLPNGVATHAFLLDFVNVEHRVMKDLGTLISPLAFPNSSARGINAASDVVGWSEVDSSGRPHAVLWAMGGTAVDLNTLIDPKLGWELISATAINDQGQIVGGGFVNPLSTTDRASRTCLRHRDRHSKRLSLPWWFLSW